jgi:ABC-type sugar transport system, ATPase component
VTESGTQTPLSPLTRSPLLEMQDIGISFGGVPALRSANLSVAAGEVHALIGQNGAGKSTMIKILTGAYRRGSGNVRFEGREVDFRTPKQAREAGISTIYQEINLVPFRSVAENIFLGREPRRFGLIDWRAVQQRAAALLESFGLQIDVKKPVAAIRPRSSRWWRSRARCRRTRRWSSWTSPPRRSTNAKWNCSSPWCANCATTAAR